MSRISFTLAGRKINLARYVEAFWLDASQQRTADIQQAKTLVLVMDAPDVIEPDPELVLHGDIPTTGAYTILLDYSEYGEMLHRLFDAL